MQYTATQTHTCQHSTFKIYAVHSHRELVHLNCWHMPVSHNLNTLLELPTFQLKQMDFILLVTDKVHRSMRNTCKDEIHWTQTGWRKSLRQAAVILLPLWDYLNSITKKVNPWLCVLGYSYKTQRMSWEAWHKLAWQEVMSDLKGAVLHTWSKLTYFQAKFCFHKQPTMIPQTDNS